MMNYTIIMAGMGAMVGAIVSLVFYKKATQKMNGFFYVLLMSYAGALIGATFFPLGNYGAMSLEYLPNLINVIPFASNSGIMSHQEIIQCSLNVILFMPLGLLIPLATKKRLSMKSFICICFLLSLSIEVIQLLGTMIGIMWRSFDVNDMIFNTFGGTLTYSFTYLIIKCLEVQKRQVQNLSHKSSSI